MIDSTCTLLIAMPYDSILLAGGERKSRAGIPSLVAGKFIYEKWPGAFCHNRICANKSMGKMGKIGKMLKLKMVVYDCLEGV